LARTVLVVDDEASVLEVVAAMLADLGCDVVTALTPNEALAKLEEDQRIAILITDVNMPGMSGYELAEEARRRREGIGVILLSGREIDGRGFPIVRKPFLQEDLVRTMQSTTGLC